MSSWDHDLVMKMYWWLQIRL